MLLTPAIAEAAVQGRQTEGVTLGKTIEPFPVVWEERTASPLAESETAAFGAQEMKARFSLTASYRPQLD
jgi:hypothetical protein